MTENCSKVCVQLASVRPVRLRVVVITHFAYDKVRGKKPNSSFSGPDKAPKRVPDATNPNSVLLTCLPVQLCISEDAVRPNNGNMSATD